MLRMIVGTRMITQIERSDDGMLGVLGFDAIPKRLIHIEFIVET